MRNVRAFSLVEIIVVLTILSILSTIGFVSYSDSIVDARDSQRSNDMSKLLIDLKSHKQKEGAYPSPVTPVNITNSGVIIYQGLLTKDIVSNVLSNIPKDPKSKNSYWYSISANKQQFQIGLTLENNGAPKALVRGDYKSVAKNIAPTLLLALTGATSFDILTNSGKFIFNGGSYNLPYNMAGNVVSATGMTLDNLLGEIGILLEGAGAYESCSEIYDAGRSMGSGTYQVVASSGSLVDTGCLMNY